MFRYWYTNRSIKAVPCSTHKHTALHIWSFDFDLKICCIPISPSRHLFKLNFKAYIHVRILTICVLQYSDLKNIFFTWNRVLFISISRWHFNGFYIQANGTLKSLRKQASSTFMMETVYFSLRKSFLQTRYWKLFS